jgi:hypothetical protein
MEILEAFILGVNGWKFKNHKVSNSVSAFKITFKSTPPNASPLLDDKPPLLQNEALRPQDLAPLLQGNPPESSSMYQSNSTMSLMNNDFDESLWSYSSP